MNQLPYMMALILTRHPGDFFDFARNKILKMIDYNAGHADAFRTDMEGVEYRREPLANSPDSYEKGRQDGHAYASEVYFRNMIAAGLMKLLPFPTILFTPPGGLGGTGESSLELNDSNLSVAGFPVAIDPIADPALYESYERILRAQTNAENDRAKVEESQNGSDVKKSSAGKEPKRTTAADWEGKTDELAKSSPIEIPDNATVKIQYKAGGYDQISYKWTDDKNKYEVRWHTKTPNAPEESPNSWVIERTTPGTPSGQKKVQNIYTPGTNSNWTPKWEWESAC